uniref:Mitochondrial import inner membrane translocase subunit n=1 Tax=Plectus sambesii TaxID=2011161 RepID=A0A914UGZ2_9BILA
MSAQVQQLKEFLTVYNHLTELCFNACVSDLNAPRLLDVEQSCVNRCIDKQMRVNQRLMVVFSDVGPQMLYGKAQQQQEIQQQQAIQQQQQQEVQQQEVQQQQQA